MRPAITPLVCLLFSSLAEPSRLTQLYKQLQASKARYGRYIRPSNQGSLWDNLQHSKEVKGPESKEDVSPWRRVDSQEPPDRPRSLTVDTRQLEEHPRVLPHVQSFQELYLTDSRESGLRSRATTASPENWLDKFYSRTIVSSRRRKDRQETAGMEGEHNANDPEHETVVMKVEDKNSISEPKQEVVDTKDDESIQIDPGLLAELPQTDLNTRDLFRPVKVENLKNLNLGNNAWSSIGLGNIGKEKNSSKVLETPESPSFFILKNGKTSGKHKSDFLKGSRLGMQGTINNKKQEKLESGNKEREKEENFQDFDFTTEVKDTSGKNHIQNFINDKVMNNFVKSSVINKPTHPEAIHSLHSAQWDSLFSNAFHSPEKGQGFPAAFSDRAVGRFSLIPDFGLSSEGARDQIEDMMVRILKQEKSPQREERRSSSWASGDNWPPGEGW